MKSHFLLGTLILICHTTVLSDKIDRAWKALQKGDTIKSTELISEELDKTPKCAACHYINALIIKDTKDSVEALIRSHSQLDTLLNRFDKQDKSLNQIGVTTTQINSLHKHIEHLLFDVYYNYQNIDSLKKFIDLIPISQYTAQAHTAIDELAFQNALKMNSIDGWESYMSAYPKSPNFWIATSRRDKAAFELAKEINTFESWDQFIRKYGNAEQRNLAIDIRNQLAYISLLEKDKALQKAELAAAEAKLKQQKAEKVAQEATERALIMISGLLGIIAILFLLGYWFKRKDNIRIRTQKNKISNQHDALLEATTKINDSLGYAQLIQKAILPTHSKIQPHFEDLFILWEPKDVVSGDFYWFTQIGTKKFIAAVDCTGHGIPGAFMSMIGNTLLNQIVETGMHTDPVDILNELRSAVILAVNQGNQEHYDGMDIGLIAIDGLNVEYAGAQRPVIHFGKELSKLKGDRMPIGKHVDDHPKSFTKQTFQVNKGDLLYLFTDGFVDQFGGSHEKKYSPKRFENILREIHLLPLSEQKTKLQTEFETWKGKEEQTDDVLVIGLKI